MSYISKVFWRYDLSVVLRQKCEDVLNYITLKLERVICSSSSERSIVKVSQYLLPFPIKVGVKVFTILYFRYDSPCLFKGAYMSYLLKHVLAYFIHFLFRLCIIQMLSNLRLDEVGHLFWMHLEYLQFWVSLEIGPL
jgi:hypothetical protein